MNGEIDSHFGLAAAVIPDDNYDPVIVDLHRSLH
jgi:hypothetical protein